METTEANGERELIYSALLTLKNNGECLQMKEKEKGKGKSNVTMMD